jgi:hypothetical protein
MRSEVQNFISQEVIHSVLKIMRQNLIKKRMEKFRKIIYYENHSKYTQCDFTALVNAESILEISQNICP